MLGAEPHVGVGREMKHHVDAAGGFFQPVGVEQIAFDELKSIRRGGAGDELPKPGRHVVEADHIVAGRQQPVHQVAPDKTRGAGDQSFH